MDDMAACILSLTGGFHHVHHNKGINVTTG
jgi:hypothetical protein